jgi:hypothetical protein
MHPCARLFSLLLSLPVVAQTGAPAIEAAVVPGSTEARVSGVAPGAFVGLVLGTQDGFFPLPGGLHLDLIPSVVASMAIADANGRCSLSALFPVGSAAGSTFRVQALAMTAVSGASTALAVTPCRELTVPAAGAEADMVILFGQSNAEGYAPIAGLPTAMSGAWPGVRVWNDVAGGWQALTAGVNNETMPGAPRIGPEMGIAEALAGTGRTIWLLKFAVGQTSLGPTPGPWNEWGCRAGELYVELLRRVDSACSAVRRIGLTPHVRGACMMQGESDALVPELAAGYRDRLADLVTQLRADLGGRGVAGTGPVRFVLGLIDPALTRTGFPAVDAVRTAQASVAAQLEACAAIETNGLSLQADGVHFDAKSQLALGRAFAAALLR